MSWRTHLLISYWSLSRFTQIHFTEWFILLYRPIYWVGFIRDPKISILAAHLRNLSLIAICSLATYDHFLTMRIAKIFEPALWHIYFKVHALIEGEKHRILAESLTPEHRSIGHGKIIISRNSEIIALFARREYVGSQLQAIWTRLWVLVNEC